MTSLAVSLATGNSKIYVCTRLFDHSGRSFGELLNSATEDGARRALDDRGLVGPQTLTFLPFRDSNELRDQGHNEARCAAIYRIDIERLRSAAALVAPIGDLHYDSGICFEIGFAAALGIPVIAVLGNFFSVSPRSGALATRIDELFSTVASVIVDGADFSHGGAALTYRQRIDLALSRTQRLVSDAVYDTLATRKEPALPRASAGGKTFQVFIEFGGGQFEYQRELATRLEEYLTRSGKTFQTAERHKEHRGAAIGDIEALVDSSTAVFLCDGWDVDPETAVLLGIAKANQIATVLYRSGNRRIVSEGGYASSMNLMIQEAGDKVVSRLEDVFNAISHRVN